MGTTERFVEVIITDFNNIGFFEQFVFKSKHSELPYPSGIAALMKRRLRKKLSIIDEDFMIFHEIKNNAVFKADTA